MSSVRLLLKEGIGAAVSWSGIDHWFRQRAEGRQVLVLGFHRVLGDLRELGLSLMPGLATSTNTIRRQLEWVGRYYKYVDLDGLRDITRGASLPTEPIAAVTFDDGYVDVHEYARPILREMGIPAAVFVIAGLVGEAKPPLHDRLYALLQEAIRVGLISEASGAFDLLRALLCSLDADDLQHLVARLGEQLGYEPWGSGLRTMNGGELCRLKEDGFVVGSHTITHPFLPREKIETVRREVSLSRLMLRRHVGTSVRYFAYPDGQFSPAIVQAVRDAGYEQAFVTCRHGDVRYPWLTVPRLMLWEGSTTGRGGDFSPSVMTGQSIGLYRPHCACLE